MMMPGRKFEAGNGYRYGYGGQEADNEIYGQGNAYTAEYWEYDPRIGRRWNVDPLASEFPHISPYVAFNNNLLRFTDPTGAAPYDWVMRTASNGARNPVWDDRVTNQETATKYYGTDATYLGKEHQYTGTGGRTINLNTDKTWTDVTQYNKNVVGGEMQSGDISQNRVSDLERGNLNNVNGVVLHRTESSNTKGTLNAFKTGREGVNYGTHFLVGKDGEILQTANLGKYTLHVGKTRLSSYPKNQNSFGIEVVGKYDYTNKVWEPLTSQQITAVTNLTNYLMVSYKLPSTSLYTHDKISYKTEGEGVGFPQLRQI